MSRTFIRPSTQIKTIDTFNDTVAAGVALETATWTLEEFMQGVISQLKRTLTGTAGDWYEDLFTPSSLETGTQRGVNDLNNSLHLIEKKRVMRAVSSIVDITVTAAQNWEILGSGELPSNTTAAVGAVTTLGTVVAAHGGTFGTHSLTEVAGATALNPKNMVEVFDASTRDPLQDASGNRIWGLLQTENAADGHTITTTTPNRAQISFVVINGTGDDLIACPVGDIAGKTINVAWPERVRLEDLTEQDFLRGAIADVPTGATVTRQVGYDNQGATAVNVTTNSTLDLEGPGLTWSIRDDLEAVLFQVIEGSAGGTSEVKLGADVDTFNVDAVVNDFANGIRANTGGTRPIRIGSTDGVIETTAGDLGLTAAGEFAFVDGNKGASTFSGQLKLSETAAEWSAYETAFGEVSLMNAITQAANADNRRRATATVSSAISANTLIEGPSGPGSPNISADLLDYRNNNFVSDVEIFINGQLMLNGADASTNNDVYPSAVSAEQQYGCFYAEFNLSAAPGNPDVIQMFITGPV